MGPTDITSDELHEGNAFVGIVNGCVLSVLIVLLAITVAVVLIR